MVRKGLFYIFNIHRRCRLRQPFRTPAAILTIRQSTVGARMMIIRICLVLVAGVLARAASADDLRTFLSDLTQGDFYEGANGFGALREDIPVAPVLKDGQTVAWAFLTSDFVGTTGYSGKPIHVVAAISTDAVLTGVELGGLSQPESDAPPRALDLSLTDVADWSFLS